MATTFRTIHFVYFNSSLLSTTLVWLGQLLWYFWNLRISGLFTNFISDLTLFPLHSLVSCAADKLTWFFFVSIHSDSAFLSFLIFLLSSAWTASLFRQFVLLSLQLASLIAHVLSVLLFSAHWKLFWVFSNLLNYLFLNFFLNYFIIFGF